MWSIVLVIESGRRLSGDARRFLADFAPRLRLLLISINTCVAQPLFPAEDAAIADIVARIQNDESGIDATIYSLASGYIASGRPNAAEALYKRVITTVETPSAYLQDYKPPIWVLPRRISNAVMATTDIAFPELIRLLVKHNKTEEALEYADMMRAKLLRAVIERDLRGHQPFEQFSPMTALQMRAMANETQSTFVMYAFLGLTRYTDDPSWDPPYKLPLTLLAWVIPPSGNVTLVSLPIASLFADSHVSESDPVHQVANLFSRTLKRGVMGRLQRSSPSRGFRPLDEGTTALHKLNDALIARLEPYLPANPDHNVVIVPDGSLYLVPFGALPDDTGNAFIERHTVSIVPSLAIYSLLRQKTKYITNWQTIAPVLIVGNPKMPPLPANSDLEGSLPPLAGADQEADMIANLFRTKALKGEDALEDVVTQRMQKARLVHFATHGLLTTASVLTSVILSGSLSYDIPPGAIVLADNPRKMKKINEGNDPTQMPINGFLSSGKILALKLDADLITLSACDTARGRTGDHDFSALPSALLAAGARSIVMTFWSIPDAPTAELVPAFYKDLLAGRTKAQALRHAMLATKQRHNDVASWGAFTLIGLPD